MIAEPVNMIAYEQAFINEISATENNLPSSLYTFNDIEDKIYIPLTTADKIAYDQPFDSSTLKRIPALYTLNDGTVIAAADIRYKHGSDSPDNLDTAVAVSKNGYSDWEYISVNYFDDYADSVSSSDSASFIDSAILQSSTGRIFILTDAFPSKGGYRQSQTGTGYAEINGKKRMLLTTKENNDNPDTFDYYIGDFNGSFAPIFTREISTATEYSVDREFRLYKNGKALYTEQKGSEGTEVQQNIFYSASDLKCYRTSYLWLRYSDDNGKTWSAPTIISDQVKSEDESFLGVSPGRGTVIEHNGKERILFCVYDNNGPIKGSVSENASVIYSDDNGVTWHRSEEVGIRSGLGKTSEAQLVQIENGDYKALRMYARNSSNYIAYSDSTDGGHTWTSFRADIGLEGTGNCMVSLIDTTRKTDGKQMILCSSGGNLFSRADGVLRVGLVENNQEISWISTYHLTSGYFGYSCLTELPDGNFAVLYEDEEAHLKYTIFSVSDDGVISEINGENIDFAPKSSLLIRLITFFKRLVANIKFALGLM